MNRIPATVLTLWFVQGASPGIAADDGAVAVYRCAGEDGLVLSDRPCSSQAELLRLDPGRINRYHPPAVTPTHREAEPQPRRSVRGPPRRAATSGPCEALRARVARLDARMRHGYGGRSGEQLRDARRAARRALIDRCR